MNWCEQQENSRDSAIEFWTKLAMESWTLSSKAWLDFFEPKGIACAHSPLDRSMRLMWERIGEFTGKERLSEGLRDCLALWLKAFDGHYFTVCKSSGYVGSLCRGQEMLQNLKGDRDRMLSRMLTHLPLPTYEDMDAIAKELYLLKKTVKDLKRKSEGEDPSF